MRDCIRAKAPAHSLKTATSSAPSAPCTKHPGKDLVEIRVGGFAARVSRGAAWPDAVGPPSRGGLDPANAIDAASAARLAAPTGSVLLLTSEDDLADTVRPRLEALGADCDKILAISNIPGENANDVSRAFALNRDLARLKNLLQAIPDCRLLVIDPVSAYLGGANEQANADVQSLLTALAKLARERDLAVIIVSHLRKKEGAAIYRTMGSLAFVAAARAAWIVCKDPADPNYRFFLPLKNNLAPDVTGLAFTVEAASETRTPVVRWSPESMNVSVDSHFAATRAPGRPDDERQHAAEWLRERLSNGSRATRNLRDEAEANGISYGTLRRAFRALGAEAQRVGPFPFGEWHWKLPGVDAQNAGGEFCASTNFPDIFSDLFKSWQSPPIAPSPTDT